MSPEPLTIPVPPGLLPPPQPERAPQPQNRPVDATLILVAASIILALSLGIRHAFGLFLQPVSMSQGWERESFALAIALQNLIWGVAQPFAGLLADRFGAGRVIMVGTLLYAAGMAVMAMAPHPVVFTLGTGVLVGLGLAGTTYPLVLGAVTRATRPDKRSLALGIAMGGAALGQFALLPASLLGIDLIGWENCLLALAGLALIMLLLARPLRERTTPATIDHAPDAGTVLRSALANRNFQLLAAGFFVCGFQVVFIATHVPAFLSDHGLPATAGSNVLALIGLLNIAGTYYAGRWGGQYRKPRLLVGLYLIRAVIIAGFAFLPVTTASAYGFGATMGLVWLSTVPLTNGSVADLFGVRHLSMLGGVIFLAHQLGAFLGGWLGGALYDRFGSYELAWVLTIMLSLVAAMINWPIRLPNREPA